MKIRNLIASVATLVLGLPVLASAQIAEGSGGPFEEMLRNILTFVNGVLIPFIIGIGFLFFVWGMFQYFIVGGANDESKEKGKSLMIYATFGFVAIIIFFGVINLLTSSSGLQGESIKYIPQVEVPD